MLLKTFRNIRLSRLYFFSENKNNSFYLFLEKIPLKSKQAELKEILEKYGKLEHLEFPTTPDTGLSKGYARVKFEGLDQIEKFMEACKTERFLGSFLKVKKVKIFEQKELNKDSTKPAEIAKNISESKMKNIQKPIIHSNIETPMIKKDKHVNAEFESKQLFREFQNMNTSNHEDILVKELIEHYFKKNPKIFSSQS